MFVWRSHIDIKRSDLIENSSRRWEIAIILNTLIRVKSFFIKSIIRSLILLNVQCFANISFFFWNRSRKTWCYDLRKDNKVLVKPVLFAIIAFNMMKLPIILQIKAGKTMIKESYRGITWCHFLPEIDSVRLSYFHHAQKQLLRWIS